MWLEPGLWPMLWAQPALAMLWPTYVTATNPEYEPEQADVAPRGGRHI